MSGFGASETRTQNLSKFWQNVTSCLYREEILLRGLIKWPLNEASQTSNRQSENTLWWGKCKGIRNIPPSPKEFPLKAMWAENLRIHHTLPKLRYLERDFEDIKELMGAQLGTSPKSPCFVLSSTASQILEFQPYPPPHPIFSNYLQFLKRTILKHLSNERIITSNFLSYKICAVTYSFWISL